MIAMSIVAQLFAFVVGVDTHARNHVYAVICTSTGRHLETRGFPTTPAGIKRAMTWVGKHTGGDLSTLWVVEGVASYGAILAGTVSAQGYEVVEAPWMNPKNHHGLGKSDPLDAVRIGTAVLNLTEERLRRPRLGDGVRAALRVLVSARESMTKERTKAINTLTALLRVNDLGVDARKPLSTVAITTISAWRGRKEDIAKSIARGEAVRLAKRIVELNVDLKVNDTQLTELVKASPAAPLLEETGVGPVAAAVCLTVWSHQGRVRSQAAFAALAGVSPIPASSGNTVRHRLNRGGDRTLNKALHMVALSRMTHDPETREYVEKRKVEGRTTKEIRRIIKRYLARKIYRILNAQEPVLICA